MGTRNRSILTIAIAFIVGLILGWIVFGWWLFPVQWGGALPQDLQPADKKVIIETASEAFALTQDGGKAVERLQALGSQQEVAQLAGEVVQTAAAAGDLVAADRVAQMASKIGLTLPEQESPALPTPAAESETAQEPAGSFLPTLLGLLLLGGGILLAAWLLLRRRSPDSDDDLADAGTTESLAKPSPVVAGQPPDRSLPAPAIAGSVSQGVHEFSATFHQGDVEYDQSFDIDAADGSYLGECGLTMSELVAGDPNRVTALEVWLFDKSDIRTVTKVLMTDFAYGNQTLRDKLSSKGDALLLSPDMGFVLDAQTLRLMGKVTALDYDEGAAPPRSTLQRLSVQLKVIRQPA
jgi:hypothetical protein